MDCDDVNFWCSSTGRVLTPEEQLELDDHLEACASCSALRHETRAAYRWVARLPETAFDDPDLCVFPTIDPIVFEKRDELAQGGMGSITRARDRRLGRDVAIKQVLEPYLQPRFEREVRITARLQHPAIVPIYEAGTWPDGSMFYTMRLVPGRTLADAIDQATTLEARLALLPHAIAVTEALAFAHSRRIVHRDLKPGNVLVGEFGETVVIDWGLAKELDDGVVAADELTRAGSVIGTPGFMPPEQSRGEPVDERADVYALGALLYNLLAGCIPYYQKDITAQRMIVASCEGPPTSLDELAPRAPADLRAIVARAMARTPERRYPTALELAADLRRFEAGKLLGARAYTTRELVAHWIRRHRAVATAVAIAISAVTAAAAVALVLMARARDLEHDARLDAEQARRATERSRDEVEHTLAAALEEQGRDELVAHDASRALPYLAAAYARGRDGVALRHLLTVATRNGATGRLAQFDSSTTFLAGTRAITSIDDTLVVRQLTAATAERTLPDAELRGANQLSRDGTRSLVRRADAPVVIELDTGATLARFTSDRGMAWELSRDGRHVLSYAAHAGAIRVYSVATGGLVVEIPVPDCKHAAISADGELVAALVGTPPELRVWRAAGAAPLIAIPAPLRERVAFDPTGGRVLVYGGTAPTLVDPHSGNPLVTLPQPVGESPITAASFDELGRRVVTGHEDGTASLWDVETAARLVHEAGTSFAISGDGARLATATADGTIRIWDSDSARVLELLPTGGPVRGLEWSADGTRLLSQGSHDASLWDVHLETRSPAEISALAARTGPWTLEGARLRPR